LSPVILERGGLPAALAQMAASATRTHGVKVQFRKSLAAPLELDSTATHHLYRIAQEAVTNAARHSGAGVVTVRLESSEDHVRLTISDDGRGINTCPPRQTSAGMGLRIMEFRARMIHAQFAIERTRRGGTRISCRLPLRPVH
jgi:signal transduction histidine kinase